ncbi:hypothetical protein [Blastococcus sp. SYSU D00820]
MLLAGRPLAADVSAGGWLTREVRAARPGTVAALVPAVFPTYARVLHPAVRYAGDDDVDVRWDEVAAHNGTTAHRLMQWPAITGAWEYVGEDDQPGVWNDSPAEGHLAAHVAGALAALLSEATATPQECWFGVCDDVAHPSYRRLALSDCEALLVGGPLTLASANFAPEPREQSAHVWWPADRAWCVMTGPTLMSTYVGGPAEVVDALLTSRLEAHPARPEDPVGIGTDPVNPTPRR